MGKFLEETLSPEELQYIINLYQENVSLREIEKLTHHGRRPLSLMLTRLGIKTTTGNHYKTNKFDYDFFETIRMR